MGIARTGHDRSTFFVSVRYHLPAFVLENGTACIRSFFNVVLLVRDKVSPVGRIRTYRYRRRDTVLARAICAIPISSHTFPRTLENETATTKAVRERDGVQLVGPWAQPPSLRKIKAHDVDGTKVRLSFLASGHDCPIIIRRRTRRQRKFRQ